MPTAATLRSPSRRLSSGIVVLNAERELLLCHVTGQRHWDLPKGGSDDGESERDTALRETREETGLHLDPDALVDLGVFVYTPKKNLHLFAALIARVDAATLHCDSHFPERGTGREIPEMDAFGWFTFDRIAVHCTANMAALLLQKIDLDGVLARLTTPTSRRAA